MQYSGRVSRNKRQAKHWDEIQDSSQKQHRKTAKPQTKFKDEFLKALQH